MHHTSDGISRLKLSSLMHILVHEFGRAEVDRAIAAFA